MKIKTGTKMLMNLKEEKIVSIKILMFKSNTIFRKVNLLQIKRRREKKKKEKEG